MKRLSFLASIFVMLTIVMGAAAQDELPKDLGKNAGTGETKRRVGSWRLVKIETTAAGFGIARQSKMLPLDTRERKGILWGYGQRRISADLAFDGVKETVIGSNGGPSVITLKVLVKAAVTGKGVMDNPESDAAGMQCQFYLGSVPGQLANDLGKAESALIYAGSRDGGKPGQRSFYKKAEFQCGGYDMGLNATPGEDFSLNYRLRTWEYFAGATNGGYEGDVTFQFYYKWQGWQTGDGRSGGGIDLEKIGSGLRDRDANYKWAEGQDAVTVESYLNSLIAQIFKAPSANPQKLAAAYADVSMIATEWASKAGKTQSQMMKVGGDSDILKSWAVSNGPQATLENLQQKVSSTFKLLNRSQQNSFFADVSAALANVVVADGNQPTGSCPIAGVWTHVTDSTPATTWTIDENGNAREKGGGDAQGTATLSGKRLTINWRSGNYAGYYFWDLDESCNAGTGKLVFTAGGTGTYDSKVRSLAPNRPGGGGGTNPPTGPGNYATGSGLSGLWRQPGSTEVYRVRHIGPRLYWGIDGTHRDSFANIYYGDIKDNMVDGIWIDLPGSPYVGDGKIFLKIESDCRMTKTSEVNHYAAQEWVKIGSRCDTLNGRPAAPPPTVSFAKDLSGVWKNPGRNELYRLRQIGNRLYWGVDATPMKSFANTYYGDITGNTVDGIWIDLPGSPYVGDGKIFLKIESDCRLVKTAEVNHYAAEIWVKQGSLCDVTGLQQKTTADNKVTPQKEEKPAGPVIIITDPLTPNKPGGGTTTQPKPKPKLEEIPDEPVVIKPPVTRKDDSKTVPPEKKDPPPPITENKPKPKIETGCPVVGVWTHETDGIGSTYWTIDASGNAVETGKGNAVGRATVSGYKLTINWTTQYGHAGYYWWNLNSNCNGGSGQLVFTRNPGGSNSTHNSTVRKQ